MKPFKSIYSFKSIKSMYSFSNEILQGPSIYDDYKIGTAQLKLERGGRSLAWVGL